MMRNALRLVMRCVPLAIFAGVAGQTLFFDVDLVRAAEPIALKDAAKDLAKKVNDSAAPSADDIKELNALVIAIFEFRKRDPEAGIADASKALDDHIKSRKIIGLNSSHVAMRASLKGLFETIEILNADFPIAAAKERTDSLSKLIKENKDVIRSNPGVRDSLFAAKEEGQAGGALVKQIDSVEEVYIEKAATRRAASLTELLNKADGKEAAAAEYATALARVDVVAGLKTLRGAIDKRTSILEPRIQIVTAFYGDLRRGARRKRRCDATDALRKHCQRLKNCVIGAETVKISQALCGYDPAPFADPSIKGLYIEYLCRTGGDEYWQALDAAPYPLDKDDPAPLVAVLRLPTTRISCATPLSDQ